MSFFTTNFVFEREVDCAPRPCSREQHRAGPSEAWVHAAPRPVPRPQTNIDGGRLPDSSFSTAAPCTAWQGQRAESLHMGHVNGRSAGYTLACDRYALNTGDSSMGWLPEADASLHELLAPLVKESLQASGHISPPNPLEVLGAFAAISSVASASAVGDVQMVSHFRGALRSLAQQGFRRCSLVSDKLGISIRCLEEVDLGHQEEQVDFPWSSVSDIQDPRTKAGLQGCAVTFGVREPSRIFEGASGALALVVRLPDRATARKLADAALAFKAYEAQTLLWKVCGRGGNNFGTAALLLDERGCAFWSLADDNTVGVEAAPLPYVMEQGAAPESTCCNICWC